MSSLFAALTLSQEPQSQIYCLSSLSSQKSLLNSIVSPFSLSTSPSILSFSQNTFYSPLRLSTTPSSHSSALALLLASWWRLFAVLLENVAVFAFHHTRRRIRGFQTFKSLSFSQHQSLLSFGTRIQGN
ncbi:PREDICTED: uncharacterized protein LOC101293722 [Fragaria vesca subsp. vesca]